MLFWPHILTFFAIVCLQTLPLTVLLAKCIGIAASATEEHTIAHEFWLLLWNCKVGSISNSQHHTQTPPLKSHYPPTWWFALKRIQFLVLSQQKLAWTMSKLSLKSLSASMQWMRRQVQKFHWRIQRNHTFPICSSCFLCSQLRTDT